MLAVICRPFSPFVRVAFDATLTENGRMCNWSLQRDMDRAFVNSRNNISSKCSDTWCDIVLREIRFLNKISNFSLCFKRFPNGERISLFLLLQLCSKSTDQTFTCCNVILNLHGNESREILLKIEEENRNMKIYMPREILMNIYRLRKYFNLFKKDVFNERFIYILPLITLTFRLHFVVQDALEQVWQVNCDRRTVRHVAEMNTKLH